MSPTVHELRNEIRSSVGRFEREVDAQFTKEELAAVAGAVGADVEGERPSKGAMRAAIRRRSGCVGEGAAGDGPFTKPELEAIVDVLGDGGQ